MKTETLNYLLKGEAIACGYAVSRAMRELGVDRANVEQSNLRTVLDQTGLLYQVYGSLSYGQELRNALTRAGVKAVAGPDHVTLTNLDLFIQEVDNACEATKPPKSKTKKSKRNAGRVKATVEEGPDQEEGVVEEEGADQEEGTVEQS